MANPAWVIPLCAGCENEEHLRQCAWPIECGRANDAVVAALREVLRIDELFERRGEREKSVMDHVRQMLRNMGHEDHS